MTLPARSHAPARVLDALRVEVADLRRRVEQLEARPGRPPDSARDAALLGAIAVSVGASVFSARELSASMDAELRGVLAGVGVRQVGAWLRRLHRAAPAPYRLRRVGRDDAGALWTLTLP